MLNSSFALRGMVRASGNAAVLLLMKSETPSLSQVKARRESHFS
jgi:hypothetical protein